MFRRERGISPPSITRHGRLSPRPPRGPRVINRTRARSLSEPKVVVSAPSPGARPHSFAISATDRLRPIASSRSSGCFFSSGPSPRLIHPKKRTRSGYRTATVANQDTGRLRNQCVYFVSALPGCGRMASSGEAQEIVIAEISSLHGGRNPCRPIFPAFHIQLPSNQHHCGENHSPTLRWPIGGHRSFYSPNRRADVTR